MKTIKLCGTAIFALAVLLVSCSGEDGEKGLQGEQGIQGEQGEQGVEGEQGLPGADSPTVDFYFQDGFKGYEGTQDVIITPNESINENLLFASYNPINEDETYHTLMRFDNVSETITNALVDNGETCEDAFYINQAVLYLYVVSYSAIDIFPLYFHFGFYNENDPLFSESDATWSAANQVDEWSAPGGESSEWAGPFAGTDDYAVTYAVTGTSGAIPGWVALPLSREVVNSWVCDENSNKGFRIRLSHSGSTVAFVSFAASDQTEILEFNPVLVIETEKAGSGTGKGSTDGKKVQDWENLTYEEQMAPLFRFLDAKK